MIGTAVTLLWTATLIYSSSSPPAQQSDKGTPAKVVLQVNDPTGAPIANAEVQIRTIGHDLATDGDGRVSLELTPGGYDVTVEKPGFFPETRRIEVHDGKAQTLTVALKVGSCPPGPCLTVTSAPNLEPSSVRPQMSPAWLPSSVSPQLYQRWRKYGSWDYKQEGFQYRDFTLFNFGATGSAAGFDEDALVALTRAARPSPTDVRTLAESELEKKFAANANALEQLRLMAQSDARLIRIAADFTYLDSETAWPRKEIGITDVRWDEYRSLFQKLSLQEGIVRTQDFPDAIFFVAVAQGLCTGGSSAGYVYSTKKLAPTSDSPTKTLGTVARKSSDRKYAYVFKELGPNWYVFYEMDW